MTERATANYVLNCIASRDTEHDWSYSDAVDAGVADNSTALPTTIDLRADWWHVRDQGTTGACVGFATADGVLRRMFVDAKKIKRTERPSPRFIWMANKETDDLTSYPTTFLDTAGTQTKHALRVVRRYGCVLDRDLPMDGPLSPMSRGAFYTKAANLRIASFHNLGNKPRDWKSWLANHGPILTRLNVDKTWDRASQTKGKLDKFLANTTRGGHAVSIVGYTKTRFIIRNSWGNTWGDGGFAYATLAYAKGAFTEAYGALL